MIYDEYGINDNTAITKEGVYQHKDYEGKDFHKSRFQKQWADDIGSEIKTIIDVGAYEGGDTLRFNSWFPLATTYSIEGSPNNFEILNHKLKSRENLKTFNYVMYDKVGEIDFNRIGEYGHIEENAQGQPTEMVMGTIYTFKEAKLQRYNMKHVDSVKVKSITLDKFCEDNNITEIDIIHADIEGASYDMVRGMNKVLPKLIFLEQEANEAFTDKTHGGNFELNKLLVSKGYELLLNLGNDFLYKRT